MSGHGAIIATGSIAYPVEWQHAPADRVKALGVSKVMTMTSTYDHRVIQGAESGSYLRRIDELLQGEDCESVAESLGVDAGVVTAAHPTSASAPLSRARRPGRPRHASRTRCRAWSCCRRFRRRPRCSRPTAPMGTSPPTWIPSDVSRRATPPWSQRTST